MADSVEQRVKSFGKGCFKFASEIAGLESYHDHITYQTVYCSLGIEGPLLILLLGNDGQGALDSENALAG